MPPARLEQFAVDGPDIGPQWAGWIDFLSNLPDRFRPMVFLGQKLEPIPGACHRAAGQEIILRDWDEPVTAQAGGSTFYGGDLDGISEKLPYLKKLGVTALYLNPVFKAPSVRQIRYRGLSPCRSGSLAVMRRYFALTPQYAAAGNAAGAGWRV